MCEPVSIATGALLVSGIVGAGGSVVSAVGQAQQSDAMEAEARENAKLAGIAAKDALARGRQEASKVRNEASETIAGAKVVAAHAGIDPSVGSPLTAMIDTRIVSEQDAATHLENSRREAENYRRQGKNFNRQGDAIAANKPYQIAGTLLGGAAGVAGSAYNAFKKG